MLHESTHQTCTSPNCYNVTIFSFMCMFCRSLFVLLSFFFWPLCCLFFFTNYDYPFGIFKLFLREYVNECHMFGRLIFCYLTSSSSKYVMHIQSKIKFNCVKKILYRNEVGLRQTGQPPLASSRNVFRAG